MKVDNPAAAETFSVDIIPAIVHYQASTSWLTMISHLYSQSPQFKVPHHFPGDLTNEKKIVQWVLGIREAA